jgi:DNA repair protein RadD
MHELRDYQAHANDVLIPEALRRGSRSIGNIAPCGSGKTSQIADLCRRAASKGNTVTVTAHRRRLVRQLAERVKSFGIRYTVEMDKLPDEEWAVHDSGADIIIGSMQTMVARIDTAGVRKSKIFIPDEAHMLHGAAYKTLRKTIAPDYTVGFSATMCRPDGSGLGRDVFDELVTVTTIENLLSRDVPLLVPVDVYAPVGVGKRRRKGLAAGVSGDPVKQWLTHANGLRTLVFCRTLAECRTVRDMYLAEGIPAVHIDGGTPEEERDEAFKRLESRERLIIVSTPSLMGVGVDLPFIECLQTLTKNHSPIAQWQPVGRIQRTDDGKANAVLLDHAAAVYTHGMPNVSPVWTLDDKDSVQRLTAERQENTPGMQPHVCPACGCVSAGTAACPKCQTALSVKRKAEVGTEREGLTGVKDVDGPSVNEAWQKAWRGMLYTGAASGMKCSATAGMFKGRFGVWPDAAGVHPVANRADSHKVVGEVFPQFVRRK